MKIKTIGIGLILVVLLVGTVAALNFDNVKSYDSGAEEISIKNAFGLPFIGSDLAKYKLTYNTDQCLTDCYAEGTATLYTDGYLFTNLIFKDRNSNERQLSSSTILIKINQPYVNTINNYGKEECFINVNGTSDCIKPIIGTHKELIDRWVWEEYDGGVLTTGHYEWRIEGKKEVGESIDWIGSAFGEDFTEWAWWDNDWSQKVNILIEDQAGSSITDYTIDMLIPIDDTMAAGYEDIRFINSTESGELGYWIYFSNASEFRVKVKIEEPLVPKDNVSIFIYYGNPAASTTSDIANAHIIGEDGKDFSEWTLIDGDSSGDLVFDTNAEKLNFTDFDRSGDDAVKRTGVTSLINFSIQYTIQYDDEASGNFGSFGVYSDEDAATFVATTNAIGIGAHSTAGYLLQKRDAGTTADVTGGNSPVGTQYWVNAERNTSYFTLNISNNVERTEQDYFAGMEYSSGGISFDNIYMALTYDTAASANGQSGWITNFSLSIKVDPKPIYVIGNSVQNNAIGVTVTLDSPADALSTTSTTITFVGNSSISAGNVTNHTVEIYNPDETLLSRTTSLVNPETNSTSIQITSIPLATGYKWNMEACAKNSTDVVCEVSAANRTFDIQRFKENWQDFQNTTVIGSIETFKINVTIASSLRLSTAFLFWNNTEGISGGVSEVDGNQIITASRTIDGISVENNVSFYWNITTDDAFVTQSNIWNQTIQVFGIDDCTTKTNPLLNFTVVDEKLETILNGSTQNVSCDINIQIYTQDQSSQVINFSVGYNHTNPCSVCLDNNLSKSAPYSLDVQVQYTALNYSQEFYHIQNSTLTNETMARNITLYDLIASDSTTFKITYKDASFLPVNDALIQVQRKYVDQGIFKTVEIPKTDNEGSTVAHLKRDDVIYTFVISKHGLVLATFDNVIAVCQNILIGECNINLNSFGSDLSTQDYTQLEDFSFVMSFDKADRKLTTTYTVPSGSPSTVIVNATLYDGIGTTQVCSDILISSSGTLTCTIPVTFGNGTAIVSLTKDGTKVGEATLALGQDSRQIYGNSLVFISIFMLLTLAGAGISDNPMITVFFLIIGVILNVAMHIVDGGIGYIGLGASSMWLVCALLIVAIKGAKR